MYLEKDVWVGAYFEHRNVKGKIAITVEGEKLPVNFNRVSKIVEHVAYWRKANQIHMWFVDNAQDGEDDCKRYNVSPSQLRELRALCAEVKAHPEQANELLPLAEDGFFFGTYKTPENNGIDEWYWKDIDLTIEQLDKLIAEPDFDKSEYYYQASW
jgi:hypothetical protein